MMPKKWIPAAVLLIFFMPFTFSFCKVSAGTAIVAVNPPTIAVNAGDYFNLTINVTNIANFTSWQFRLYYLKSVLNCSAAIEGPFLKTGGGTFFGKNITYNYNSTHGWVLAYCTLLGMTSVSGSGVIATVTFRAMRGGSTPLHLTDIKLGDEKIPPQPIPYTAVDGTVQVAGGTNHDVAITNVISNKNITGKGYTCNITVTTENHGGYEETYSVVLHVNETETRRTQVTVQAGGVIDLGFTWNTSGYAYGAYSANAYAEPVPGETYEADNNYTGGQVLIVIPGDVQTPYGKIDMKDIAYVARRFLLPPSDPLWEPNADINNDGRVDMKDVAVPAKNFGKAN